MGLLRRGAAVLREEGILTLFAKGTHYLLPSYRHHLIPVYSAIAKWRSPIEHYGVMIPTDNTGFDEESRSRVLLGYYEEPEAVAIRRNLEKPRDVVDLGASSGFLTVLATNQFDINVTAVAVEGNPELIPLLEETRELNDVDFHIEGKAYHPTEEETVFYKHHLSVGGGLNRETEEAVQVSATNLDNITAEYGISNALTIVDIEGAEADLIQKELDTLEEMCGLLIVEFHEGFADGIETAKERLKNSNFTKIESVEGIEVYENRTSHQN